MKQRRKRSQIIFSGARRDKVRGWKGNQRRLRREAEAFAVVVLPALGLQAREPPCPRQQPTIGVSSVSLMNAFSTNRPHRSRHRDEAICLSSHAHQILSAIGVSRNTYSNPSSPLSQSPTRRPRSLRMTPREKRTGPCSKARNRVRPAAWDFSHGESTVNPCSGQAFCVGGSRGWRFFGMPFR